MSEKIPEQNQDSFASQIKEQGEERQKQIDEIYREESDIAQGEAMEHFIERQKPEGETNKAESDEEYRPGFAIPKEEQTPEVPPTPETEKEEIIELTDVVKERETVENKIEQTEEEKNLNIARENYFKEYKEFLKGSRYERLRSSLNLPLSSKGEMSTELKELKTKYDQAKQIYAESKFEKFKLDIGKDKDFDEKKKNELIGNCKNEILKESVLGELEKLGEIKKEALSESKKGLLSKSFEKYKKMSPSKKIAFATIIATGTVGFASLAVPISSLVAALGLGTVAGKRILRGSLGVLLAGVTGKTFDKVFKGERERVQSEFAKQTEKALGEFDIDRLGDFEKKYQTLVQKKQKADNKYLIAKMLTMGAVGAGAFSGLSFLDKYWGISTAHVAETGNSTRQQFKIDSSPVKKGVSSEVSETVKPEIHQWGVPVPEETIDPIGAPQETNQETTPDSQPDLENHKVKSGETLWKILKGNIPEIEKLGRSGMKDNVIANLIEEIKKSPQDYGITSGEINTLKIGDNINLEKIQDLLESKKIGGESLIKHTEELGEETLKNIEDYKKPTPTPQAPVTTEGASPEVSSVPEPKSDWKLATDSPEFEKFEGELDEQIDDIHKTQSELARAQKQISEMEGRSLTSNPEQHELNKGLDSDIIKQQSLVDQLKDKLGNTKEGLSESQKKLEDLLLKATHENNVILATKARLGLAEILLENGDKEQALQSFRNATEFAKAIENRFSRIEAFTNIAVKEISAGFKEPAVSTFDFAETSTKLLPSFEKPGALLKIALAEADNGLTSQAENTLREAHNVFLPKDFGDKTFEETYSSAEEEIKRIIERKK